ncbi:hypothetical protein WR25_25967 [Diploscapter pachys]|uniref:Coatomer subunit gamma n=1 Tax=Diploscapter pachys TaxID=2018661 RepID=A0A2A2KSR2_9BILA|nr:hypothetical protein WR25_25967 [Diploscapter pachys]
MSCNVDLEKLITDSNRSIATLAITTLLKTGAESSVERLMKQISSFVSEIGDEFKIVVIDAIRSLCSRYPRKHSVMMPFLYSMLRSDGGFEPKKAIVETIIAIIEENQDAKAAGLSHLCEFIEDCEYDVLSTRVLHLLGREAPHTTNPSSFIRYIYNRVILESTKVRAAAVTALAKFGAQCADLRSSIEVLLRRCLLDGDDEVRDRATFCLKILTSGNNTLISEFILEGLQVSPTGLESCLLNFLQKSNFSEPFDLRIVPVTSQPISKPETRRIAVLEEPEKPTAKTPAAQPFAEELAKIAAFRPLGPLFKSSAPTSLTESVAEYTVQLIKHVYANHVVLQFNCRNTLNDQLLEDVHVELEDSDKDWVVEHDIPIESLPYGETKPAYLLLPFPESGSVIGTFSAALRFKVKDVDPATGEPESDDTYEDRYVLEEAEVTVADSVQPSAKQSFAPAWQALDEADTIEETFQLSTVSTIPEAITKMTALLGLAACERSDRVPEGKSQHTVVLSGIFRGGFEVLSKVNFAIDPSDRSINMHMLIRSVDNTVATILASAIA